MNNFSQLLETAKRSPFARPFAARCDSSMDSAPAVPTTVVPRTFSACAADEPVEFGSLKYYALCGFGGILSCGITHTAIVPLDLVKCRIQLGNSFRSTGLLFVMHVFVSPSCCNLSRPNFSPKNAAVACSHNIYTGLLQQLYLSECYSGLELSYLWRTSLYLAASASAEFFADIALCPMEACKVRIQTQPGCSPYLSKVAPLILKEEGLNGFYKGISPLWMRQIPYTMMKFACFERTVELLYKHVVPKPRDQCSKPEQLVVTFIAGYIAGVFCAVVSHPADTVVSKLNQEKGSTAIEAAKKLGMADILQPHWQPASISLQLLLCSSAAV
ncbi:hypothetical protein HPB50_027468 [Hyalomma asiaticum]|uniref:Uncharacterized protein n=1 Tax=Hyalomma asiaticum TaxID=266040 RepID=A0ACB7S648_HYAAI|nr:hypothetical protein HPB50_027468 [Hyalomma asiaticum]